MAGGSAKAKGVAKSARPPPPIPPPTPSSPKDSTDTMVDSDSEPQSSRARPTTLTLNDCIQTILSHPLTTTYAGGKPNKPILKLDLENNPHPAPKGPYFDPALYWKNKEGGTFSFVFIAEVIKSPNCLPRYGPYYNNTGTGYGQVCVCLPEVFHRVMVFSSQTFDLDAGAVGRLRVGIPTALFSGYSKLPDGRAVPEELVNHAQSTAVMLAKLESMCNTRQGAMRKFSTCDL